MNPIGAVLTALFWLAALALLASVMYFLLPFIGLAVVLGVFARATAAK